MEVSLRLRQRKYEQGSNSFLADKFLSPWKTAVRGLLSSRLVALEQFAVDLNGQNICDPDGVELNFTIKSRVNWGSNQTTNANWAQERWGRIEEGESIPCTEGFVRTLTRSASSEKSEYFEIVWTTISSKFVGIDNDQCTAIFLCLHPQRVEALSSTRARVTTSLLAAVATSAKVAKLFKGLMELRLKGERIDYLDIARQLKGLNLNVASGDVSELLSGKSMGQLTPLLKMLEWDLGTGLSTSYLVYYQQSVQICRGFGIIFSGYGTRSLNEFEAAMQIQRLNDTIAISTTKSQIVQKDSKPEGRNPNVGLKLNPNNGFSAIAGSVKSGENKTSLSSLELGTAVESDKHKTSTSEKAHMHTSSSSVDAKHESGFPLVTSSSSQQGDLQSTNASLMELIRELQLQIASMTKQLKDADERNTQLHQSFMVLVAERTKPDPKPVQKQAPVVEEVKEEGKLNTSKDSQEEDETPSYSVDIRDDVVDQQQAMELIVQFMTSNVKQTRVGKDKNNHWASMPVGGSVRITHTIKDGKSHYTFQSTDVST